MLLASLTTSCIIYREKTCNLYFGWNPFLEHRFSRRVHVRLHLANHSKQYMIENHLNKSIVLIHLSKSVYIGQICDFTTAMAPLLETLARHLREESIVGLYGPVQLYLHEPVQTTYSAALNFALNSESEKKTCGVEAPSYYTYSTQPFGWHADFSQD